MESLEIQFAQMVREHKSTIFTVCYMFSKDQEEVNDLFQEVLIFDRAIVLLWLENMNYEEIAAIVGISVKNVSVRLVRIKEQLKKMSNDNK